MRTSCQELHSPVWSKRIRVDDKSSSDPIAYPIQFFLRLNDIHKYVDVQQDGLLDDSNADVASDETIPILFAFVYDGKYVVSTKRFESLCEKIQDLDEHARDHEVFGNIDYIVFWRQEDADFVYDLGLDIPMIDFSLLSHLLIGGFQNLSEETGRIHGRITELERKRRKEWADSKKGPEMKPALNARREDGTLDIQETPQVMCFTLEAFFYDNYDKIMLLSRSSLANLDELTDASIGEMMLQTVFPKFAVHPMHKFVHLNGPATDKLTIVNKKLHMFRLGHVFMKNLRGEFNISDVIEKFRPFVNHHILQSAILDIDKGPIGTDEHIANGILFSQNNYVGHYETFGDMTCNGIVIGRTTHVTLDEELSVVTCDTNLPSHLIVFFLFNYVTKGHACARNMTTSAFPDIEAEDLNAEEFAM